MSVLAQFPRCDDLQGHAYRMPTLDEREVRALHRRLLMKATFHLPSRLT
jgi:hypothetical protein